MGNVHELSQLQSETESVGNIDGFLEREDYHQFTVQVYLCFSEVGFLGLSVRYVYQYRDPEVIYVVLARREVE